MERTKTYLKTRKDVCLRLASSHTPHNEILEEKNKGDHCFTKYTVIKAENKGSKKKKKNPKVLIPCCKLKMTERRCQKLKRDSELCIFDEKSMYIFIVNTLG